MANIQQVAKQAGVSVATVSRVLNGQKTVSGKTRMKVEEAIKKLNYEPSMLGRNLRNSESRLLLILIPTISNPFYLEIIKGIEQVAISQNYNILLCETDSDPERENIYFDLVRKKMADGIISMDPAVNGKTLKKLAENYAIIQCSEYEEGSGIPYVTIDNEEASYRAVKHLVQIGHKKIALINSDEKYLYARQRKMGYNRALEENGIALKPEYIIPTQHLGFENGQQAMKKILNLEERPTAVFAVSDLLAIGALKEINASGLHVPSDMAVVGFDKIDFSNMTNPTLTTIAQPMHKMGTVAAKMLIDKIKGIEVESIILDHDLVIRESTSR
ncbi:LacI family DNA-binding transcriptional regulator [Cytobacillus oceanisediminis]|uniref:LacI family DNA-binding transcriptional regulator n=1 Tax=Cytobacillus TaxID=2675230 RepID=UPI00203C1433|nr:LacI family DNA-binding transcriptional regulator [Cytobacillus oceanisediminis]MBY0157748.1 LacI family DNA-binding transcriptional regulator [Cytobacillus firmus]MCM3243791.1 LacI family DNA-binding transcriptional regulator [Cytobacillus oceanisediminis]MCM3528753.1 LacI family DNA-binding transcriptional regulator [Cytobacillus oceanisediminis]MCS0825546.1 LacI family DNA-binding transcriptional regulator [Cytobacillus firmus]